MNTTNYQAIIFDLYGVVIANSWQDFKKKHFDFDSNAWRQMVELGRKVDAGQADYQDFVSFIATHSGESPAEVRNHLEHNVPNDALLEYISQRLKPDFKVGVLSNASTAKSTQILTPDQRAIFDTVVLSRDVGFTKPQPEMYRYIADTLQVDPVNCLYIDDQPEYVAGAEAVGMTGVLYDNLPELRAQLKSLLV